MVSTTVLALVGFLAAQYCHSNGDLSEASKAKTMEVLMTLNFTEADGAAAVVIFEREKKPTKAQCKELDDALTSEI